MVKKIVLAVVLVLGLTFPAAAAELEIYSAARARTAPHMFTLTLAQMLNDLHPQLKGSGLETMGTGDMLRTMDRLPPERRKTAFGIGAPYSEIAMARLGLGRWKRKFQDLKFVSATNWAGFTFFSYDAGIKLGKDLAGKRVGIWPKRSSLNTYSDALFKVWGISDRVKISHHGPRAFKDLLLTGTVDAIFVSAGAERADGKLNVSGYMIPILQARKSYYVHVTKEEVETLNQQNPWKGSWRINPKGSFPGGYPLEDSGVMTMSTGLWCWETADANVVYDLVKFLDEKAVEWTKRTRGSPMGGPFMVKQSSAMAEDVYHPGALKYYKEKGYIK
ncbi:MAG: TAXI family TRAP transporter solute-binding subunit [Desulfobacteraceae bacterium]|jgi:TRAP-type uncharacterized transport system substrate-binding protein